MASYSELPRFFPARGDWFASNSRDQFATGVHPIFARSLENGGSQQSSASSEDDRAPRVDRRRPGGGSAIQQIPDVLSAALGRGNLCSVRRCRAGRPRWCCTRFAQDHRPACRLCCEVSFRPCAQCFQRSRISARVVVTPCEHCNQKALSRKQCDCQNEEHKTGERDFSVVKIIFTRRC